MAREMKDSGIEWIGEIPREWTKDKVIRLFREIGSGTTPSSGDEYAYTGEINWIQSGDINGGHLTSTKKQISEEALNSYSALRIYSAPFIVIAMYGASIGNISISEIDGCVNQACCVLRESGMQFDFAFYTLKAAKDYLIRKADGGGQPNISQDKIKSLWLAVPMIEEQAKIAGFLNRRCSEIDATMEQTRQAIEEYKALKQAVITEAVTKGVRGDRPMKDSGVAWIGRIPIDWNILKFGAIAALRNGYVGPTRDLFQDAGVCYIQSLHIKDGKIDFGKQEYYVSEDWAKQHPKIHTNDLLIVQTGDIGQVGLVPEEYNNCNCHALIIAEPKLQYVVPHYLMYYLLSYIGKELLLYNRTGALLPHLNSGKTKFTPIILPTISEQYEIIAYLDAKCAEIDALISAKQKLLAELETYKKSVIYEYVTGKKEAPVCP